MADTHAKNHDYHILDPSPWPLIGSIGALIMAIGAIGWMQAGQGNEFSLLGIPMANPWTFLIGTLIVLYTMFGWWSDTVRESLQGHHTKVVSLHLRYGMIMFIASEVMFFVAWFWAVFDASLFFNEAQQVGRMEYTGGQWPPAGMEVLDPLHLPLYNTVILLLSGTTVTWAHHALLHNDRQGLKMGLWLTILLAILFTCVQVYEFVIAPYSFSESLYGATFFMATGFHGFHVFVGTIFLIVCLVRVYAGQLTPEKHFGFEAAAWYWHFVDVVWLFLFFVVYIWGTWGAPIYHH
ncbi:cytochrome c oxidase subunit 3 [Oceaniradius stylonematis]|uniref:cytochrome c oxidase subunit 3 n=1 Tax=Oceaniradius stylonematis TaxID=2184161 RepID=UPI00273EE3E3|nr:cytochrome c oxidase subunit 3 [Oceaniradius stylonematis]